MQCMLQLPQAAFKSCAICAVQEPSSAEEDNEEAAIIDQHPALCRAGKATTISAMGPPLSPSSLSADEDQPRETHTARPHQGAPVLKLLDPDGRMSSYACSASSLPINISALSRQSSGPGQYTFSQALGACRRDYLATSAAALSCADGNTAQDQQVLHSSQDSMLSDGGTKVWHFRPACPVHCFEQPAPSQGAAQSASQQTLQNIAAQRTASQTMAPRQVTTPAAAGKWNGSESDRACHTAVSQDTAQASVNPALGGRPSRTGFSPQRIRPQQSFDKENSGNETSTAPSCEGAETDPGRASSAATFVRADASRAGDMACINQVRYLWHSHVLCVPGVGSLADN